MMDGSSGFTKKRHEKILSVFDQTYIQDGDPQFVSMSGRDISEDKDMERIINRLAKAATISDIRMTMNIEDEIYSELENLDTKILSQKKPWLKKINSWPIRKSSWLIRKNGWLNKKKYVEILSKCFLKLAKHRLK